MSYVYVLFMSLFGHVNKKNDRVFVCYYAFQNLLSFLFSIILVV